MEDPRGSTGAHEALAETIDEFAVGWRKIVVEAVDGFDDDAPLGESGDRAQRVEPRLHLDRYTDAQLRVILDLLPFAGTGGRASCSAPLFHSIVGHGSKRWRRTAEIRGLRCVSDECDVGVNTSDNVMPRFCAKRDPRRCAVAFAATTKESQVLANAGFARAAVLVASRKRRGPRRSSGSSRGAARFLVVPLRGARVACLSGVTDTTIPTIERRSKPRTDRRKQSRGGRRTADPHVNWRRIAWVFAAYAIYLSVRSLPASVWRFFKRERTPAVG